MLVRVCLGIWVRVGVCVLCDYVCGCVCVVMGRCLGVVCCVMWRWWWCVCGVLCVVCCWLSLFGGAWCWLLVVVYWLIVGWCRLVVRDVGCWWVLLMVGVCGCLVLFVGTCCCVCCCVGVDG